jgi:NitT/TauT family transport system substrate-binding protein
MSGQQAAGWTRRAFLGGVTLTGMVGLLGVPRGRAAAEPPPETTTLRLMRLPSICEAPVQMAGDLLMGEGFSEVQYVQGAASPDAYKALAAGDVHMALLFAGGVVTRIDTGAPLVLLGGIHVGCFELFGSARVHSVRDLEGKIVAVPALGSHQHLFVASIAAYVGLDPRTDIHWAIHRGPEAMQLLAEDKIDGLMGFPPRAPGVAGEADRPCGGQQHAGSPLVAILLLHGGREPGVRPEASGGHQTGPAGALEGL